jgi:hypothetical protein
MLPILSVVVILASAVPLRAADWKPAKLSIPTRWSAEVSPANALPEYPRPQMVRPDWTNLNGLWDYAITGKDAAMPEKFEGKILVPYPVESALSGVRREFTAKDRLWYHRSLTAPDLSGGKRLLLHFGAVDHDAVVWLNGKQIGAHQGGYDAFTFDITEAVNAGPANNLTVAVLDATGANGEPHGKQTVSAIKHPGGIMYTPCSGIWQTVWLEPVPATSIASLRLTPDVDAGTLRINPLVRHSATAAGLSYEAVVLDDGREVARGGDNGYGVCTLKIPHAKLWWPDKPFLYDLKVSLLRNGQTVDAVQSYFGMRKISLGKDASGFTRILLNGKFVFQSGPLDQGFWPDGIYTAPTDEALRYDIEIAKKLGFNMARKHVKVEPERWYYWCDRLGLLVWQDMPSGGGGKAYQPPKQEHARDKARQELVRDHDGVPASPEKAGQFEKELTALVQTHWNHPSIILWVVFNEGWGQYDTARLTQLVKQLDPSRLVTCASGWTDRNVGDISDVHSYPGPGCPARESSRASVLGEFGGLGLAVEGHTWVAQTWGYRGMSNPKALTRKYLELWQKARQLRDEEGLCAAVYTQITDVETECNGLLTYDRKVVKVDLEQVAAGVGRGEFPPEPQYRVLVPTAEREPVAWRYTTTQPPGQWFKPGFDAATWKEGPAGFGTPNTPNVDPRTEWRTDDIWIRREVTLPDLKGRDVALRMYHDDDAEVYINGVPAGSYQGYTTHYEFAEMAPAAVAALKPGKNLIAIHCHQVYGGQYIDAGLSVVQPPAGKPAR